MPNRGTFKREEEWRPSVTTKRHRRMLAALLEALGFGGCAVFGDCFDEARSSTEPEQKW